MGRPSREVYEKLTSLPDSTGKRLDVCYMWLTTTTTPENVMTAYTFRAVPAPAYQGKAAWYGQARAAKADRWQTVKNSDDLPIIYVTAEYARAAAKDLRDRLVEEPITPVIFRRMKKKAGGEIVAIFPTDAASYNSYECGCYAHVGQHGACSPFHIILDSRAATPADYADLKAELESAPYGYRFKVYARMQRGWQEVRERTLHEQGGVKIPKAGDDEREEIVNRHARAEV